MPVDHEEFRLEQFRQAHEHHRHYDRMAWIMVSLLLPVALGVFTLAANYVAQANDAIRWEVLAALGFVSVATLISMRVMVGRMSHRQDNRSRPFIEKAEEDFCGSGFFEDSKELQGISKHTGVRNTLSFLVVIYFLGWLALSCVAVWGLS